MMTLRIMPDGRLRCIYGEEIDLGTIGTIEIRRASHVEPDVEGRWKVDLTPVGGPLLGTFKRRSEALAAEHAWLERYLEAISLPVR